MAAASSSSLTVAVEVGVLTHSNGAGQSTFVGETKHQVHLKLPTSKQLVTSIAQAMQTGANEIRVFDANMNEVEASDTVQTNWSQQTAFRAVKISTIDELEHWISTFQPPAGRSKTYFFTDANMLKELNAELDKICDNPELKEYIKVETTEDSLNGVRGGVAEVSLSELTAVPSSLVVFGSRDVRLG